MKVSIFAGLLFFSCLIFCHAQNAPTAEKTRNKIDDIKNVADIDELLESIDKKRFEVFIVEDKLELKDAECQKLADDLKITPWTKADFDNNGYTDLLVIGNNYGHSIIVVMDEGGNKFTVKTLTKRLFQNCTLPVIESKGKEKIIKYQSFDREEKIRTLIYKFGDFVELNESPENHKIEKIKYKTTGCFGTCPIFELTINADRSATYDAIQFNRKKGKFKGTILQPNFDEVTGLLNYLDFTNLKDSYAVGWTDDQSSGLVITFDGGKVKTINDYGLIGTFGLNRIYKILFYLRENQQWK